MSGKLVGEVIAASGRLREQGLPERGFHALVAIAEKCHHESRQGSVPWSHIRAGLFGASKRTAERAVRELRRAELVQVIATGFGNQRLSRAPIYEMAVLDTDTTVSASGGVDTDTQVSVSVEVDTDKPSSGYRQTGSGYRHPRVVLNGSINGSTNGSRVTDSTAVTTESPPVCPRHPNGSDNEKCGPCGAVRRWHAERPQRERRRNRRIAQARRDFCRTCRLCESDDYGNCWLIGSDGTPVEPATRCPECAAAALEQTA